MIKSMTGYGKAVAEFEKKQITVEMRSVNSKQLDVNMRIPGLYREKELELRQLIAQKAERGKIDFSVSLDNQGDEKSVALNRHLVKAYFHELQTITMETGQHHVDFVGIIATVSLGFFELPLFIRIINLFKTNVIQKLLAVLAWLTHSNFIVPVNTKCD
jgi:uncharacterized protein (TIGR00255 family)